MRKNISGALAAIIIAVATGSCSNEEKTFFIGDIKVISFEKQRAVSGEHLNIDSIGVNGVTVLGKYLVMNIYGDPHLTQIYDLKTLDLVGNFLIKGQGPDDFGYISVIKEEYPHLWVQDWVYKNIQAINIEDLIANKQAAVKKIRYDSIVEPVNAFYVNDTCLLIKSYDVKSFDINGALYYCYYNPENGVLSHETAMYNYPVTGDILQTKMTALADCMKPDGSKVASISGVLDQVDILDMHHPEKSISATTTNHRYSYAYIKNTRSDDMQTSYFSYPDCSDELIFALYENNNTKDANNIELHIIDCEGNPVYKLRLDQKIETFSIDFDNGFMYGISKVEEKLYRYDIKDILKNQV
jgi:hypothetical protein